MIILSIDLGKTCGISVWSTSQGIEYTEEVTIKSLLDLDKKVKYLITRWIPNLILIPYPTRFYRVILNHSKLMGVVELEAEKKDTQVIEVQDGTCKKTVLGNGRAKKEDIAEYYKDKYPEIESEHVLDSILFTHWYLLSTDQGDIS
jgi:Holliday junction resolvasome RuvABC endonuclease subunit